MLEHGVAIMATGAAPHKPDEYCYGQDERIVTSLELDQKLMTEDPTLAGPQHRRIYSVRGLPGTAAHVLLAGLLHPFGGQCPEFERRATRT